MRQAAEIKQETRQINSSVTVMFHGRKVELARFDSFFGVKNVEAVSFRGFSYAGKAICSRPSLSRNLTASRVLLRRLPDARRLRIPSLSYVEKFCVGMPSPIFTGLVSEADPTKTGQLASEI